MLIQINNLERENVLRDHTFNILTDMKPNSSLIYIVQTGVTPLI